MDKKKSFVDILGKKSLIFDGGTGTVLQKMGLPEGTPPEAWSIEFPEKITALHRDYLLAGADIIKTNTFGVNPLKYPDYERYILAAVECARDAVGECGKGYIAFDIGPLGKMIKPFGDLDFERAVELFSASVRVAARVGVDLILIETMNDALETKAAVLAAKECSSLPVVVTNVYDETGKLLTGASPEAMVATLEGLGVSALGANCSLGPDKLLPIARRLCAAASVPVVINPNAGLPTMVDGETVFLTDPDAFSSVMAKMAEMGVSVLGGCCGTNPEYIRKTLLATENIPYKAPVAKHRSVISSYASALYLDNCPVIIGERINPTGKHRLKEALRSGDISYILSEAIAEEEAGADALDVNVGLPEIDEKATMVRVINELQAVSTLPLQIDTGNASVMDAAMRIYGGKPLVNSVNGKASSMGAIFPLVKKYGGCLICLTLDEDGIPEDVEGRVKIAEKIASEAAKYKIGKENLVFDPLAMAVSSNPEAARVTLDTVSELNKRGYLTSLGVSNVSFGLPARDKINAAYFTMALSRGLNAAIINPHSTAMLDAYHAYLALSGKDAGFEKYISYASGTQISVAAPVGDVTLSRAIVSGLRDKAGSAAEALAQSCDAMDIVNGEIIPALREVGEGFETGKIYLPQLLMSAEAAAAAFEAVKPKLVRGGETDGKKRVILATVKGDVHDIGKNIVKTLLESYGYSVVDLGRDVSAERVAEAVEHSGIRLVGLSALMTTTVPAMEETVRLLHSKFPECKVFVGGAVITEEYAEMIGADGYGKDAMAAVHLFNGASEI